MGDGGTTTGIRVEVSAATHFKSIHYITALLESLILFT
jgi:hypothetical protein